MNSTIGTTCTAGTRAAAPGRRPTGSGLLAILGRWLRRVRDRRRLQEMPEHLLRDMGISREIARREAAKPFWRP